MKNNRMMLVSVVVLVVVLVAVLVAVVVAMVVAVVAVVVAMVVAVVAVESSIQYFFIIIFKKTGSLVNLGNFLKSVCVGRLNLISRSIQGAETLRG